MGANESSAGARRRRAALAAGALLLLAAALLRGGLLIARLPALDADPDSYRALAERLATEGLFGLPPRLDPAASARPTAYRPPLYPLLLSLCVVDGRLSTVRTAWLHLTLGVAAVAGVARLGRLYGLGRLRWAAAGAAAVDPLLLHQSTLVMTETAAAALAVAVLLAWERFRRRPGAPVAAVAGLVVGLAALCRPTFLPCAGLLALLAAWESRRRTAGIGPVRGPDAEGAARPSLGRRFAPPGAAAVALALGTVVALSPWLVRNRWQFDRWIASTTHGGYTLLLGNNPDFYDYLRRGTPGQVWAPESTERLIEQSLAASSEPARPVDPQLRTQLDAEPRDAEWREDRRLAQIAWGNLRSDPSGAVRASLYRIGQLWSPLPHATGEAESTAARGARYAVAAWYVGVFGAATFGLARRVGRGPGRERRLAPWRAGVALCLVFTAVHSLYWSNLRMRAPLMPFVGLLAAAAFVPARPRRSASATGSPARSAGVDGGRVVGERPASPNDARETG